MSLEPERLNRFMELFISVQKAFYTHRRNQGIEQKIKPAGGNQWAFSNQKPLTIKPYPMKIRCECRR